MSDQAVDQEKIMSKIHEVVREAGADPDRFEGKLISEMLDTSLKLIKDKHTTAQLKLITNALREMRYAYRIFNEYTEGHRFSIFGSARTPEDHPDYLVTKEFSEEMTKAGWMCITGAADGIMKAGHEGSDKESSFGLSIRLAFESTANSFIEGDPKLINFRYFFTRKVMFMSHSEAAVFFPGGVGTMDELFEILTLMQTGKSQIIPVVLLEGKGGNYWKQWIEYFDHNLLGHGWVSEEDRDLFYQAPDVLSAVHHILHFYKGYHSSRYVRDHLVLRLHQPLKESQLDALNQEFSLLVKKGKIKQGEAFPEEDEFLHLPRISFAHTRTHIGLVRRMIDRISEFVAENEMTS